MKQKSHLRDIFFGHRQEIHMVRKAFARLYGGHIRVHQHCPQAHFLQCFYGLKIGDFYFIFWNW